MHTKVSPMDLLVSFEDMLYNREVFEDVRADLLHLSTYFRQQSTAIHNFKVGFQTLHQRICFVIFSYFLLFIPQFTLSFLDYR